MKILTFSIFLGITAVSNAQFTLSSVSGSFVDGGSSAYSVGDNVNGYGLLAASGANASFSLDNSTTLDGYDSYARAMAAFKAQNFSMGGGGDTLDVQLPSNRTGGTSAAAENETRMFGVTSSIYAGTTNSYNLAGSVSATGTAGAEILMESQSLANGSPNNVTLDSGAYSSTSLDNGAWDLDPTVGNVRIDKDATPNIALNYTIPTYLVQRQMVNLVGESFSNPFYDRFYSDMLFFMSNASTTGAVGDNRFALNHEFAPGDMSSASLTGGSGTLTLDVSTFSVGTYSWFGGDIVWNWMGDTDGFPTPGSPYPATGNWVNFQTLNVDIVPEPGSMFVLAAGIGALVAKRRKRSA